MSWEALKSAVSAVITDNGNNEITGPILEALINDNLIPQLGENLYRGLAVVSTDPGTPEKSEYYIAKDNGVYANFGGLSITNEIAILKYNGSTWVKDSLSSNVRIDPSTVSNPPNGSVYMGIWRKDGVNSQIWTKDPSGNLVYLAIDTGGLFSNPKISDGEILTQMEYTRVDPSTIGTPAVGKVYVGIWRKDGTNDKVWTKISTGATNWSSIEIDPIDTDGLTLTNLSIDDEVKHLRIDPETVGNPPNTYLLTGYWNPGGVYKQWFKKSDGTIWYGMLEVGGKATDLHLLNQSKHSRIDPTTIGNPPNTEVYSGFWLNGGVYKQWFKNSGGTIYYNQVEGSSPNSTNAVLTTPSLITPKFTNEMQFVRVDPDAIGTPPAGQIYSGYWRKDGTNDQLWTKTSLGLINWEVLEVNLNSGQLISSTVDFALITDIHVNAIDYAPASKMIEEMFSLLKARPNLYCIGLGDMIDHPDNQQELDELQRLLNQLSLPLYTCVGNHDVALGSQTSLNTFYATVKDAYYGNPFSYSFTTKLGYYHANLKGIDFIFLNQMHSSTEAGATFQIDATQETWLQNTLDGITGTDKRVIVCSHVSLLENSGLNTIYRNAPLQSARIRTMFENWNNDVGNGIFIGSFNGHRHSDTYEILNGINYIGFNAKLRSGVYTGNNNQLAFSFVSWDDTNSKLTITGGGLQDDYEINY